MKRLVLFLTLSLCILSLQAQSGLSLFRVEQGQEIPFDSVLNIDLTQRSGMADVFMNIVNNSSEAYTFYVNKSTTATNEDNELSMCVADNCLAPFVNRSTSPITIPAGGTCSEFHLEYTYVDSTLTTAVFTLEEDQTGTILKTFVVKFGANLCSVPTINKQVSLAINAMPNPANNITTFNYSIPNNYNNAKLLVRNTLGSVVKEISLKTGINGKYSFNTSKLNNGVYFYTIVADGQNLMTKKLIVKH